MNIEWRFRRGGGLGGNSSITCYAKEHTTIFDSVELELEYQTSTTKLYEFPLLKEESSIVGETV